MLITSTGIARSAVYNSGIQFFARTKKKKDPSRCHEWSTESLDEAAAIFFTTGPDLGFYLPNQMPDHGASFLSSRSQRFIPSETFAWVPPAAVWDDVDVDESGSPLLDVKFGVDELTASLV